MKPELFVLLTTEIFLQSITVTEVGFNMTYSATKKLIENILFCLFKSDWQTPMVGMSFRVSINVNKGKTNQESKTANSSS